MNLQYGKQLTPGLSKPDSTPKNNTQPKKKSLISK